MQNIVNVLNDTDLYTLKWQIICYVNLAAIEKKYDSEVETRMIKETWSNVQLSLLERRKSSSSYSGDKDSSSREF